MKKLITNILICMFLLLTTSSLVGCTKDNNRFNTELFKCMYNKDKTGVIILELTDKGQEQEILVIPEEINDLPVIQLGGEISGLLTTKQNNISSNYSKKVYVKRVPSNISGLMDFSNATVVLLDIGEKVKQERASVLSSLYFNCKKVIYGFELKKEEWIYTEGYDKSLVANVLFYLNGDLKYFDYYEENGLYLLPQEYDINIANTVWYNDSEYHTRWNEKFILPTNKEELKLYAKMI